MMIERLALYAENHRARGNGGGGVLRRMAF